MSLDPVAALRPCAIDVQLGEFEYTIPARPASVWLEALLETDADGAAIVPGLLVQADKVSVWDDYADGTIGPEDLVRATRDALQAAAGRPWWEADRLIRSAAAPKAWPLFNGKLIMKGVRLEEISLAAFINAVWTLAVEGCKDEAERDRLEMEVRMIPGDLPPEEQEALLDELAAEDESLDDFVIPDGSG